MCNAWNHSSNCRCGWGGEDHSGRRVGNFSLSSPLAPPSYATFKSLESYTRPNARCPVCHASVFFYQSPNGGKVYFDELGGDWPKHPCTSNNTSRRSPSFSHLRLSANSRPILFTRSAKPLVVSRIESHQFAGYTRLFAELNGKTLVLWTSCLDLQEGAPFFCTEQYENVFEIETISVSDKSLSSPKFFKAYLRQMDFEQSRSQARSGKCVEGVKRAPSTHNQIGQPQKITKRQLSALVCRPKSKQTALSIAFARAVQHE